MVNRGEEKVWVQMNVVPRSTGNTNSGTRELTLKCKLKCYFKPMNNPLGVSPSKGKQGTTRGKEKIFLTSVGIEPTTYGLDLPSLCRLSYKVAQRKSGTYSLILLPIKSVEMKCTVGIEDKKRKRYIRRIIRVSLHVMS